MTTQATTSWLELARVKVYRLCGPEKGEAFLQDAMAAVGVRELRSADDLLLVADHLISTSGFSQAVGFALQFQATLHGGVRRPRP